MVCGPGGLSGLATMGFPEMIGDLLLRGTPKIVNHQFTTSWLIFDIT